MKINKQQLLYLFLWASLIIFITSCTPSVPSKYLQEKEIEDILYDYHLADAMYNENSSNASLMIKYKVAVLKKHGVTEAQFDSSMVYYARHTQLLQRIYESLADRMGKEALALGASVSQINAYNNTVNGDTANIWHAERAVVMSPYKPFNIYSYSLKADTTFKKGDNLLFNFDAQFIYQDGTRDAVAVIAVKYNNDSTATQTIYVSTPNHYSTQITDQKRIGIKEINGYFIINNNPNDAYSTTLKLMILKNIALIKMHTKPQQTINDTLKAEAIKPNNSV